MAQQQINLNTTAASIYNHVMQQVSTAIEKNYGIRVGIRMLEAPRTGEFSGKSIVLHKAQSAENQLFLLLHLFGHNVQWQVSETWRNLGLMQPEMPEFNRYRLQLVPRLKEIHTYEKEACQYGLQLLHDCGILTLDQWLSDWFAADWRFLHLVYNEGWSEEKSLFFTEKYFREGSPLLTPLEIPAWQQSADWPVRFAF